MADQREDRLIPLRHASPETSRAHLIVTYIMRTSGRPGCGPKPVHPVLVALLFVVVALQGALGQGLLAALAQAKDAMQERPVDALEPAAEPVTLGARPTTPPLQTASLSAVAAPAASSAAVLTKLRGQVREPTEAEMLQATQRWRLTEAQAKELGVSRLAGALPHPGRRAQRPAAPPPAPRSGLQRWRCRGRGCTLCVTTPGTHPLPTTVGKMAVCISPYTPDVSAAARCRSCGGTTSCAGDLL